MNTQRGQMLTEAALVAVLVLVIVVVIWTLFNLNNGSGISPTTPSLTPTPSFR